MKKTKTIKSVETLERERERVTFSPKGFICSTKNIDKNKIGNVNKFQRKKKFHWHNAYLFCVCLLI